MHPGAGTPTTMIFLCIPLCVGPSFVMLPNGTLHNKEGQNSMNILLSTELGVIILSQICDRENPIQIKILSHCHRELWKSNFLESICQVLNDSAVL